MVHLYEFHLLLLRKRLTTLLIKLTDYAKFHCVFADIAHRKLQVK